MQIRSAVNPYPMMVITSWSCLQFWQTCLYCSSLPNFHCSHSTITTNINYGLTWWCNSSNRTSFHPLLKSEISFFFHHFYRLLQFSNFVDFVYQFGKKNTYRKIWKIVSSHWCNKYKFREEKYTRNAEQISRIHKVIFNFLVKNTQF